MRTNYAVLAGVSEGQMSNDPVGGCGEPDHPPDCDCDVRFVEPIPLRPIARDSTIGQILDRLVD